MTSAVATIPSERESSLGKLLSGEKRFSRLWLCLVAACILGGATLRLANLGKFGFWTDEFLHVFAAKSYLETGQMFVPMVGDYHRASATTYITAGMFKLFGESETAARLPFALINIVFLGFSAIVVRRLFSEIVSGAYVFGMAFAPIAIEISRWCRFYTAHQLFYFAASMALFAGFENASGRVKRDGHKASFDWRWLALSVPLALVALHFQLLTVNIGIASGCYLIVMAGMMASRKGWWNALRSKYALTILFTAAAGGALYHFYPALIMDKIHKAMEMNAVQVAGARDSHYYRYFFVNNFPALTFLFPVGMFVAVRRYGKVGLHIICSSAPLLILHAFVFDRKADRYIFYILPFFLITAVIAIEPFLEWGWERLRIQLKAEPFRRKILAAALLLPGIMVFTHPWLTASLKLPFQARQADWKSLDEELKRNLRGSTVVTMNPHAFLYYVGKYPEYYRMPEIRTGHAYEPTLIRNDREFNELIHMHGELYFIGTDYNFNNDGYIGSETRSAVQYLMSPVDHLGDRRIVAFHK